MSNTVIKFEDVSKYYRLGVIGTTTIRDDFRRMVARLRGQSDPTLQIEADLSDCFWILKMPTAENLQIRICMNGLKKIKI